ncbi:MAG: N-6 DNA methylase [Proteobacteria bacterium]|nr:N-6 DNA methylase [Pseudomonadota bacterium]
MLDSETKARIDSARDILVGKVPDPKSQVEQITIALIYKFMDDMDRQSEEIGGKVTFFSGEYKKYTWSKLLDKKIGGQERLLFYAEGIEKMNENKNIPQLFRDIFKGAFLPYRDPETLNLFLKEINGFTYDHSERLGDAFEYLLSVLSSQGDAGQFRTPRHIIDFIVQIVDPKKNETVLDPACGTAGFLISSYKHILAQNTKDRPGDQLTADERGRLMTNFCGYDISPDMVRLSRVNLYLHSFANPRIHEYDTLTSEERWDERYDVILANPPFMTPKGGIRPHNRFSIKAKRSEVLFVDYIAEHLNVNGRAGVIVPEGIIFQSQNAYKTLRKMLVENYLWCVVSLPAGCFNPYSGVKTSVLLMDKSLTKRIDEILFVKIENDGFDLGAQRRPIEKNDLPEALRAIADFRLRIAELKKDDSANQQSEIQNQKFLRVSRALLLESPDINLSGGRYRVAPTRANGKWPKVSIGDLCDLQNGRAFKPSDWEKKEAGGLPIIRIQNLNDPQAEFNYYSGKVDDRLIVRRGDLLFSWSGSRGTSFGPHVWERTEGILNQHIFNVCHKETVNRQFFYWMLKKAVEQVEENLHGGVGLVHITKGNLERIEIPLPPLDEQERIVAELESYRKIIEGAKQVVANYKPTIRIDPVWPIKELGNTCRNLDGKRVPIEKGQRKSGKYPYYGASGIVDYVDDYIFDGDYLLISEDGANLLARATLIAFSVSGKAWVNNHAHVLRFEDIATQRFVELYINSIDIKDFVTGAAQPKLSQANMNRIPIPFPPLDIQRRIVAEIEAEQALVEANRKLIEVFERKIQAKLAEIWGEK